MSGVRFADVRSACARVARVARFVRLREDRLQAYADTLPVGEMLAPEIDPLHHFLGTPDATAAYVLTLDTVNFGSGYFPHLRKRPGMSGYFTIASCLKDRFEAHGPLEAVELVDLDARACATLFGQDLEHEARSELMESFARALRDLGALALGRFDGSFRALISSAGGSGEALASTLATMPFFRDVARYDQSSAATTPDRPSVTLESFEVPLYKRAQITVSDLALALPGDPLGSFRDLAELTMFADNLVPHVLRVDGLLAYAEPLAARLEVDPYLPAGSAEEVEVRAVALHAVERLVGVLRERGHRVTAQGVDVMLWNRGQEERYRAVPRHRTRTVFY